MAGICRSAARSLRRIAGAPPRSRPFAAAAAVEYETEWEEEEERRMVVPAEYWGEEMGGRGVQWVFMGAPGLQKRACATRVAELLEVPYISMGSLVRQELHTRSAIYTKIANAVNEGMMVPEEIIFGLLSKRLEEGCLKGEAGFILDGIPRSWMQAEVLDQIADVDLVVNFKCVEDCLVKKQFGSNICLHCGRSFDESKSDSTILNPCLGTRTRHSRLESSSKTDIEGSCIENFHNYTEQSKLLEEYYMKQNKLLNFQVSGGPGETWKGLLAALQLQHVDATNFSPKLTI